MGGATAWAGGADPLRIYVHPLQPADPAGPPGVRLVVFLTPAATCVSDVAFHGTTKRLKSLTLGTRGAGSWSWAIAPGLPGGTWTASVSCRSERGATMPEKRRAFDVGRSAGPPLRAPALFLPGSVFLDAEEMNAADVRAIPSAPAG